MPKPPDLTEARIHFTKWGKKPAAYRLPGLDIITTGRDKQGKPVVWSFALDGLLAN